MPKPLQETTAALNAPSDASAGRFAVDFITPGWGSSGYYSEAVLEQAATDKVIPAGTQMYADHPTAAEDRERPVRSVKDLVAVVTEDATWDNGALSGTIQVVPAWRPLLEDDHIRSAIGLSIRGSASDIVEGEAEGRKGGIIEGLVAPVLSVDFVTRAGRGGKVRQLLESAQANARAVGHGIEEATVNDTREELQNALRDSYGQERTDDQREVYVWVRDFDDTTVWFEISGGDDAGLYGQGYTMTDTGAATLGGNRSEVRVKTTYVPVTRPDSTTTESQKGDDSMAKIQIEESEHTRLTEQAGRVDALESERDTLLAENVQLKADAQRAVVENAATAIVDAAKVPFTALERRGLLAQLPLTEAGELDADKFTQTVTEAAAELGKPTARVRGFGDRTTEVEEGGDDTLSDADLDNLVAEAFGRPVAQEA